MKRKHPLFVTIMLTAALSLTATVLLSGCDAGADSPQSGAVSQPASEVPASEPASGEAPAAEPDTDANGLDYSAFIDHETGEVIRMGDARARLDELFGEAEEEPVEEVTYFKYLGGDVRAAFDEKDRLFAVEVQDAERFGCMNYHCEMTEEEIAENFDVVYEFEKYRDYAAFFDADGGRAGAEDFTHVVKLIFNDGRCDSFTLYNVA